MVLTWPQVLGRVGTTVQSMFTFDELRGAGATAVKSALLLSVSFMPPPPRSAAVVLDSPAAAAVSKQFAAAPQPTRSTNALCGLQGVVEPLDLSPILPAVALRLFAVAVGAT